VKSLIRITNHKKMHVKNIEMEVHYELETMMMITWTQGSKAFPKRDMKNSYSQKTQDIQCGTQVLSTINISPKSLTCTQATSCLSSKVCNYFGICLHYKNQYWVIWNWRPFNFNLKPMLNNQQITSKLNAT
jgi:hypothetical protein